MEHLDPVNSTVTYTQFADKSAYRLTRAMSTELLFIIQQQQCARDDSSAVLCPLQQKPASCNNSDKSSGTAQQRLTDGQTSKGSCRRNANWWRRPNTSPTMYVSQLTHLHCKYSGRSISRLRVPASPLSSPVLSAQLQPTIPALRVHRHFLRLMSIR